MIKSLAILALMVAVASAAIPIIRQNVQTFAPLPTAPKTKILSQPIQPGQQIAILRLENDLAPDGSSYRYIYETENGISAEQSGALGGSGPEAGINSKGSYLFTSPEGVPVQISYVADENGYQPAGDVLPTPPPIPEAILRSLEYNAAHPEPETKIVKF